MGSMEEFIHYEKLIIFKRQLADPSIHGRTAADAGKAARARGSETLSRKGRRSR